MRRKEWDRSDWSIALLSGVGPQHHINMKTGPVWKAHRRLLQDLMTPKFLKNVAAENICWSAQGIVRLWETKARVAGNRPFDATPDIFYAALDAVLDFSFGESFPHRAVRAQTEAVSKMENNETTIADNGKPFNFASAQLHETLNATLHAGEAIGEVLDSPWPKISWWWKNNWQPSDKNHRRIRQEFIKEQIFKAVERLESQKDKSDDAWIMSAVDLMMDREQQLARKDGRQPVYWSNVMRDEVRVNSSLLALHSLIKIKVLGFVIAGHDTTSTTLLWALKHISDNLAVQTTLRSALHASHIAAFSDGRMPSAKEISRIPVPYLDAVIEEILRCSGTISMVERQ